MENAYAQALWKMIKGGMEPAKAVHALHELLKEKGRAVLMPRVARAFERLAKRELSRSRLTLTVAREHDVAKARRDVHAVVEKLKLTSPIETAVDKNLIGGWRLEGNEQLVDASFKKHLLSIYSAATAE